MKMAVFGAMVSFGSPFVRILCDFNSFSEGAQARNASKCTKEMEIDSGIIQKERKNGESSLLDLFVIASFFVMLIFVSCVSFLQVVSYHHAS